MRLGALDESSLNIGRVNVASVPDLIKGKEIDGADIQPEMDEYLKEMLTQCVIFYSVFPTAN